MFCSPHSFYSYVDASIDVSSKGFRGGNYTDAKVRGIVTYHQGESYRGKGSHSTSNNDGGERGGQVENGWWNNSFGGGGSYGMTGRRGKDAPAGDARGGECGDVYGDATLMNLFLGSGVYIVIY